MAECAVAAAASVKDASHEDNEVVNFRAFAGNNDGDTVMVLA
jgi:hypothetical protein